MLQQNVGRARDLVARTGGEEMAVIMPDADLTGALVVANRMRAAVHNAAVPSSAAAHPVVTISLGVAATRDPAATSTAALAAAADRALYRAKREGRNRVAESVEPLAPAGVPDA